MQGSVFDLYRKGIFGNDKALLAPQCFRIREVAGRYAAAGVERRIVARDGDARFFKGFPLRRFEDGGIFILSTACDELPDIQIISSRCV